VRVFVEKKSGFDVEATNLRSELAEFFGLGGLKSVRVLNFYDVSGLGSEEFERAVREVLSEPNLDSVSFELPVLSENEACFGVELLPAQFDARSDSAQKCIEILTGKECKVRCAKFYLLSGVFGDELERVKKFLINPVEAREFVEVCESGGSQKQGEQRVKGFLELDENGLKETLKTLSLAMSLADLKVAQDYFKSENREPTVTEVRVLDTYWSDHCRHTTFNTELLGLEFTGEAKEAFRRYLNLREELGVKKPVTLMDMATVGAKALKKSGDLKWLDESEEINACSVRVGEQLFMFKNETHNHPTEIEPFGGAATCLGGAIRDPLSGRAYVFGGARLTGAAGFLKKETLAGKLSQHQICLGAAAGFASYGNQIGVATPLVEEFYHEGFVAKRLEMGAVFAVANADAVRREAPKAGDSVVLVGGRTGADGVGGATGSSKGHDEASVVVAAAEVQKGNAPVERKIQRLFRRAEATRLIKRCNDFGAGGVSVAVGELAGGVRVNLDAVKTKRAGLSGATLALSESQERMACVVAKKDVARFVELCESEDVEATEVAEVTEEQRLVICFKGEEIVNLSREFLDKNGAKRSVACGGVEVCESGDKFRLNTSVWNAKSEILPFVFDEKKGLAENFTALLTNPNVASTRGLKERFDFSVGASTIFAPFGGVFGASPQQSAVFELPRFNAEGFSEESSNLVSAAFGFEPFLTQNDEFAGAYKAVVQSVAKVVASGAERGKIWLSLQEFFGRLGEDAAKWQSVAKAMLGALSAQLDLKVAAVGGKDSMSGSFALQSGEVLDVPPCLVALAVGVGEKGRATSGEFKNVGSSVWLVEAKDGDFAGLFGVVERLLGRGVVKSVRVCGSGGVARGVFEMAVGNGFGFLQAGGSVLGLAEIFAERTAAFLVEVGVEGSNADLTELIKGEAVEANLLGHTTGEARLEFAGKSVELAELKAAWEGVFGSVYATECGGRNAGGSVCGEKANLGSEKFAVCGENFGGEKFAASVIRGVKPRVVVPAFFGTNCEFDTKRIFEKFGAKAEIFLVKNSMPEVLKRSVDEFARRLKDAQILFIPGGFSGADEPEGSAKFITAFFRNGAVSEATHGLLARGGLVGGICNGFQALIKLGLLPYGRICEPCESAPTLSFNTIGRHQARVVSVRVESNLSAWLATSSVGDVRGVAISHGEGRFVCSEEEMARLVEKGQICTRYCDWRGGESGEFNPNGSFGAVEGICSEDGRVFGRMGHVERGGFGNVPLKFDYEMFRSAVEFFGR